MEIPFDLLYIVASFYTKPRMKLYDWIPEEKLDWWYLSRNPNAITMIEIALLQDPYKIDWSSLSFNPKALHLLEKYPDKIDWCCLSENPNAIHLLKANLNKIYLEWLSKNPSIFEIDTVQMNLELTNKANNIDF